MLNLFQGGNTSLPSEQVTTQQPGNNQTGEGNQTQPEDTLTENPNNTETTTEDFVTDAWTDNTDTLA